MIAIEPFGEAAIRVRFEGSLVEACLRASAIATAIRDAGFDEVIDVVSGARTVVVELSDAPSECLRSTLAEPTTAVLEGGSLFELPVVYDGEDLVEVAASVGMRADEVVSLHASGDYVVALIGFSPGFPYLLGTPSPLDSIARRDTPRTKVPAGSLAIAGGWSGVYPAATPGGWWLIGRTTSPMFDVAVEPPATLAPGDRVRFVPA